MLGGFQHFPLPPEEQEGLWEQKPFPWLLSWTAVVQGAVQVERGMMGGERGPHQGAPAGQECGPHAGQINS